MQQVMELVDADLYDEVKLKFAVWNSIPLDKGAVNFFGNERAMFLDHLLPHDFTIESVCSSEICPQKDLTVRCSGYPTITDASHSHFALPHTQIINWFFEEESVRQ